MLRDLALTLPLEVRLGHDQCAQLRVQSLTRSPYRRAPAIPEIRHDDPGVHSLIDVDSPHVSSVPSDFESQEVKTETQADRERLEQEADDKIAEAKEKAGLKKQQAKKKASQDWQSLKANSDNPVFIGNAVTLAAVGGLLGFGAYRKHIAGELTWKIAGLWAGAVGLFGVADYYVSQYVIDRILRWFARDTNSTRYFFKRYPPK